MDRQITLVWRRAWPRVGDGEEMDFVLVCHNSHGTFHKTLQSFVFPSFIAAPNHSLNVIFFTGLTLTELFVVFQSRSDWVALPLLLFPLTHPICRVSTGRILQTPEKLLLFFFSLNVDYGNHT